MMTASWPRTMAPKIASPHSAVPQNFQTRGGRGGGSTAIGDMSGLSASISGLSWQGPLQQRALVVVRQVHRAVHAGMACGKPRGREQLGALGRNLVERGGRRE